MVSVRNIFIIVSGFEKYYKQCWLPEECLLIAVWGDNKEKEICIVE